MPADPGAAAALDALEAVVHNLGDELAFFRRRALDAERRLRDVLAHQSSDAASGAAGSGALDLAERARLVALEAENADLRARIADAAERARVVASRMRFARQQDDTSTTDGAS